MCVCMGDISCNLCCTLLPLVLSELGHTGMSSPLTPRPKLLLNITQNSCGPPSSPRATQTHHFSLKLKGLEISSKPGSRGEGLDTAIPSPQPWARLPHVPPSQDSQPIAVCWALAHFAPTWRPVWRQLERDALMTWRDRPRSASPLRPPVALSHAPQINARFRMFFSHHGTGEEPLALNNCLNNN